MQRSLFASLVVVFFLGLVFVEAKEQPPLVSIIIPTYNRPQFLTKALEFISRQDYPNLEVVIVDDSDQPNTEMKGLSFVKYIYLPRRYSIGEKRNIAVANAEGTIIAHWDDDDYFRPHRISAQVQPILDGKVDMTVLEHHFYFDLSSRTFYTIKRPSSWGPHFATFVYRKSLFDNGLRYPDNSMAEDYAFGEFALKKGASILVMNNEDGKHVYVRHQNTWEFNLLSDFGSQIRTVPRPHFFSEEDFQFFISVEIKAASKPPKLYPSEEISWNRPELQPAWNQKEKEDILSYTPHYPKYNKNSNSGLSDEVKIGIGVGVAAGVVLIVGIGIAAYFFFQWQKSKHSGYVGINAEA